MRPQLCLWVAGALGSDRRASLPTIMPTHTGGLHSSRRSLWPQCHSPSLISPSQSPAKRWRDSGDRAGWGWGLSLACPSHSSQAQEAETPFLRGHPAGPLASWPPRWGRASRAVTGAGAGATYTSPFDGISQEPHNVVAFCSRGLEALGPVEKDALWGEEGLKDGGASWG